MQQQSSGIRNLAVLTQCPDLGHRDRCERRGGNHDPQRGAQTPRSRSETPVPAAPHPPLAVTPPRLREPSYPAYDSASDALGTVNYGLHIVNHTLHCGKASEGAHRGCRAALPREVVSASAGTLTDPQRPRCPGGSEPAGNRTQDLRIKSPLLCQLSYRLAGKLLERQLELAQAEGDAVVRGEARLAHGPAVARRGVALVALPAVLRVANG